ncbi:MAG: hypothetical protein J5669_05945 [Bacteroidales bacterium]|nr:hypothetical protein [Bacteroidales bacterium]
MTPVYREGYKFCQELCIPCYQTDKNGLLKPAAFMDLAQEIAYWAADALGFGYDQLHVHHTAWVLARMHLHFEKPVLWRDQVKLCTWHKGPCGLVYLRDFELKNAQGERAVSGTSSWVVMDDRTRRVARPEELKQLLQADEVEHAIGEPAPKLIAPKEMESVGTHVVNWSEIDINAHTNNVRYVVWAMDCLMPEDACRPVKDLYINFNRETTVGERIELFHGRSGKEYFFEGRAVDGKSCFVVRLSF